MPATLSCEEIQKLCQSKCGRHGVNPEFFFRKIKSRSLQSPEDVFDLIDRLMFSSFQTEYDQMYENMTDALPNETI